jgi:hypothetical protein
MEVVYVFFRQLFILNIIKELAAITSSLVFKFKYSLWSALIFRQIKIIQY